MNQSSSVVYSVDKMTNDNNYQSDRHCFNFTNFPLYIVNAIQRSIMTNVDTLAIDLVEIHMNDSPIKDEMIAHRLGLIPFNSSGIHTGQVRLNRWDECYQCDVSSSNTSGGGGGFEQSPTATMTDNGHALSNNINNWDKRDLLACTHCSIIYDLDVVADCDKFVVRAEHLKMYTIDTELEKMVYIIPNCLDLPITKLNRGGRLRLRARVKRGSSKCHAKWNPTVALALTGKPHIELDRDLIREKLTTHQDRDKFVSQCPRNVFTSSGQKIVIEQLDQCNFCLECTKDINRLSSISKGWIEEMGNMDGEEEMVVEKEEKIRVCKVSRLDNEHKLSFEIDGSLSPITIVRSSTGSIVERLRKLRLAFEKEIQSFDADQYLANFI